MLLQAPQPNQVPFWLDVAKTITGPLIAAAFVVVGVWLKEVYERRRAAQVWYEQYYIADGLDLFIAHINALSLAALGAVLPSISAPTVEQLPLTVIARLQTLFGNIGVLGLPFQFRVFINELDAAGGMEATDILTRLDKVVAHTDKLVDTMADLRRDLLVVNIKSKSDVYQIRESAEIKSLLEAAEKDYADWYETVMGGKSIRQRVEAARVAAKEQARPRAVDN